MSRGEWLSWQLYDPTGQRKYINREERRRFLAAADRFAPPIRTLCYLITFTGCRISEALALTVQQIDLAEKSVVFRTLKRRRLHWRSIPVPGEIIGWLLSLMPGQDGCLWPVHRVTAWYWIKRVFQVAGVTGPMATPKGLRHGFGIWAAEKNVPIRTLEEWLGHSSIKTTAIYLDAVGPEARRFAQRMWSDLPMAAG